MSKALKIIFMGTPDFAVPALQALIDSKHEVIAVYTQPPRPKGRGHKLQESPVHEAAKKAGIRIYTPDNFKQEEILKEFEALGSDAAVVAGYGMILPQRILDAPVHGCLNIHPSLLPRWRGTAPIPYAIWKGDKETGVCVMRLVKKMDAGPVLACESLPIAQHTTTQDLNNKLWPMGGKMIVHTLDCIAAGGLLDIQEQKKEEATYTEKLSKEDGRIYWIQSAEEIDRQVRALNPWPGTFTEEYKVKAVALSDQHTDKPAGTILDKKGHIACGDGSVLQLLTIQPPDKKPMDFISALNGGYVSL